MNQAKKKKEQMKSLLREKAPRGIKKNCIHGKEAVRVVFDVARSSSPLSALPIFTEVDNSPQSSHFPPCLERNHSTDLTAQRR